MWLFENRDLANFQGDFDKARLGGFALVEGNFLKAFKVEGFKLGFAFRGVALLCLVCHWLLKPIDL